jgi:hypothetical protein
MDEQEFADREQWYGSFYELGMAYPPHADEQILMPALQMLWQHPLLTGPFVGPYSAPAPALQATGLPTGLGGLSTQYGLLGVPQRRAIGCHVTVVMRPHSAPLDETASDRTAWLILAIPTGMLELAYRVQYPIVGATNPWIPEFERHLVGIAETVYQSVPFDLAVIGEEATALADTEHELTAERLAQGGYLVSPRLAARLRSQRMPETLPTGLLWFVWTG